MNKINIDDDSEVCTKKYRIAYETTSTHEVTVELDENFFDDTTLSQVDVPECDGSASTYEQECLPIAVYNEEGDEVWTI
jgi:hypothetical protein|tara:strand:- start:578 stop:814 length:237 start_codon:yes stop_codon:yes gene_type:complete